MSFNILSFEYSSGYSSINCINKSSYIIDNNKIKIPINLNFNNIFSDPYPNIKKKLKIAINIQDIVYMYEFEELRNNDILIDIFDTNNKYIKNTCLLSKYKIKNNKFDIVKDNHKETYRNLCRSHINFTRLYELPNFKSQSDKCILFVDFRELDHVEFILRKSYYHLNNEWSALIICGNNNYNYMNNLIKSMNVNVTIKKYKNNINNISEYTDMLLDIDFWNLIEAKHVLLIQEDALLMRNNIDAFLMYDYIGAPWPKHMAFSKLNYGNGGFTIRNVEVMKEILRNEKPNNYILDIDKIKIEAVRNNLIKIPEDVFFSRIIQKYSQKIPSYNIAKQFSCENIVCDNIFGMHNIWHCSYNYIDIIIKNIYKVNVGNISSQFISGHRSGWKYTLKYLNKIHNDKSDIMFIDMVDIEHINMNPNKKWIGILHTCLQYGPEYLDYANIHLIFENPLFISSLSNCLGIYVLSKYMIGQIKNLLDIVYPHNNIKINMLYHPTDLKVRLFDIDNYMSNTNKYVIQLGSQLRKISSVLLLKTTKKLLWLPGRNLELSYNTLKKDIDFNKINVNINNVELKLVNDEEYDDLLSKNICFIDLYDASCNNSVIECIARHTPIIVKKLDPVIEYLGLDYPLYFDTIEEANLLINNVEKIKQAHIYLRDNNWLRERLTGKYFLKSLINSDIYKSL